MSHQALRFHNLWGQMLLPAPELHHELQGYVRNTIDRRIHDLCILNLILRQTSQTVYLYKNPCLRQVSRASHRSNHWILKPRGIAQIQSRN